MSIDEVIKQDDERNARFEEAFKRVMERDTMRLLPVEEIFRQANDLVDRSYAMEASRADQRA